MQNVKENRRNYKYGFSHTRIDNIYKSMLARCYNEKSISYKNYGAKGVKVCEEWRLDKTNFFEWAFNNGYKENLTLDRINASGNYAPNNCRWATYKEQGNNKNNNKLLTFDNETHTLTEWSELKGIRKGTLWARLNKGWSLERALTTKLS